MNRNRYVIQFFLNSFLYTLLLLLLSEKISGFYMVIITFSLWFFIRYRKILIFCCSLFNVFLVRPILLELDRGWQRYKKGFIWRISEYIQNKILGLWEWNEARKIAMRVFEQQFDFLNAMYDGDFTRIVPDMLVFILKHCWYDIATAIYLILLFLGLTIYWGFCLRHLIEMLYLDMLFRGHISVFEGVLLLAATFFIVQCFDLALFDGHANLLGFSFDKDKFLQLMNFIISIIFRK